MPTATRAFVRMSFIYLGLGTILGALLLLSRWVPLGPKILALRAGHIEFLVVGWLTQLILGMAWWLLPPLAAGLRPMGSGPGRRGQTQRGSERLFWATFASLNVGILFRVVFEPLVALTGAGLYSALAGLSGLWLLLAACFFVANTWRRVREMGGYQKQDKL